MIVGKKGDYTNYTYGYSKFAPSRFHHSLILTWWIDRMILFALVPSSPKFTQTADASEDSECCVFFSGNDDMDGTEQTYTMCCPLVTLW